MLMRPLSSLVLLLTCLDRLQANEHDRAEQLRGVIERLGPAYVKVAQAMSTRVDLLSPEYYMQIQLLQDRVPPFPCDQAKEVRRSAAEILLLFCSPKLWACMLRMSDTSASLFCRICCVFLACGLPPTVLLRNLLPPLLLCISAGYVQGIWQASG
jgi:hypothetical protein